MSSDLTFQKQFLTRIKNQYKHTIASAHSGSNFLIFTTFRLITRCIELRILTNQNLREQENI